MILKRVFAVLLFCAAAVMPLAAQDQPDEKLIAAQVDLKMAIEQMPEYIAIIKDIAQKPKSGDYNELRSAIDRLRRDIRLARGESRCFKTGFDLGWRVRALELDLQALGKEYYKAGLCDIPFLIDDMDAIPAAIASTLKPITAVKPKKRPAPGGAAAPDVAASTAPAAEMSLEEIKATLAVFRASTAKYVAANKGKSLSRLDELVPDYLPAVPPLKLPGAPVSGNVMIVEEDNLPPDIGGALSGTGGWLVIGDSNSPRFGQVYINSEEKSSEGKPWYQY
ncbi:MAG: hypothetical protein PHW69_09900 [Elusimicrobiaceae bacterium]|nr:hypothetical protein [Elusimicrobiaceae bacterium]